MIWDVYLRNHRNQLVGVLDDHFETILAKLADREAAVVSQSAATTDVMTEQAKTIEEQKIKIENLCRLVVAQAAEASASASQELDKLRNRVQELTRALDNAHADLRYWQREANEAQRVLQDSRAETAKARAELGAAHAALKTAELKAEDNERLAFARLQQCRDELRETAALLVQRMKRDPRVEPRTGRCSGCIAEKLPTLCVSLSDCDGIIFV